MKYLVLLGDGMADHPRPELDGRTPIEAAETPAMDEMAVRGVLGRFCPIPEGLPPGSDIGNLAVFGFDPHEAYTGRAPLEAAAQGITLADDEVAFRCNLVTLAEGVMRDFTSGHITSAEGAAIIGTLNTALSREFPVQFHSGVSYRHLAILRATADAGLDALAALSCTPPHDITGTPWEPALPAGEAAELLRAMMARSRELLRDHPVNQARIAEENLPATSIWPWGQGRSPSMATYKEKFGLTGAVISAVDLVKGIGTCAGLEVLNVPGATGWIDTNYDGKIQAALDALERCDFVYLHVEAPDETAHQGRTDLKVSAISDFDRYIVAPALEYATRNPDIRLLAAPDHFTLIETKTHAGGEAPFVMCGPGVAPNGFNAYSEKEAAKSPVLVAKGHELTARMIQEHPLNLSGD